MTNVIHIDKKHIVDDDMVNFNDLHNILKGAVYQDSVKDVLHQIVEINNRYGNSWAQDGIFINFADIKDKLTRLEILVENNQLTYSMKTQDDYGNVIFDLLVRCLLTMIMDKRVGSHLKNKYDIDLNAPQRIEENI